MHADPSHDFYSNSNTLGSISPLPHPVKKNYRKVHVPIFYWEVDELRDVVRL